MLLPVMRFHRRWREGGGGRPQRGQRRRDPGCGQSGRLGDSAAFVRCDVASEADMIATVAEGRAALRAGLDIAYLNAGVGGAFGPIAETSVEDWDQHLRRSDPLGVPRSQARPAGDEEAR